MITKEQATAFLNRITEAKRMMDAPLFPDRPRWGDEQAYTLNISSDASVIHVEGAEKLAKALNHPYIIRSFTEDADVMEFHWGGYKIRDLILNKRISHIKA